MSIKSNNNHYVSILFDKLPKRLLSRVEAASYCGMSVESFSNNCNVRPIRVRSGQRGLRYDLHDLNDWIDSKKSERGEMGTDSISLLEKLGHV